MQLIVHFMVQKVAVSAFDKPSYAFQEIIEYILKNYIFSKIVSALRWCWAMYNKDGRKRTDDFSHHLYIHVIKSIMDFVSLRESFFQWQGNNKMQFHLIMMIVFTFPSKYFRFLSFHLLHQMRACTASMMRMNHYTMN